MPPHVTVFCTIDNSQTSTCTWSRMIFVMHRYLEQTGMRSSESQKAVWQQGHPSRILAVKIEVAWPVSRIVNGTTGFKRIRIFAWKTQKAQELFWKFFFLFLGILFLGFGKGLCKKKSRSKRTKNPQTTTFKTKKPVSAWTFDAEPCFEIETMQGTMLFPKDSCAIFFWILARQPRT